MASLTRKVFVRDFAVRVASLLCLATPLSANAKCEIKKMDLPVTMAGQRPMIAVKLNGRDANFLLDSGASFGIMSSATAAEYGLRLSPAPAWLHVSGIGGAVDASVTRVKEFGIAGVTVHDVEFLVGGGEVGASGLLGQNFLVRFDDEYDFANGVARLLKAEDCKKARLAYWVTPGQSFSEMDIEYAGPGQMHTVGTVFINGTKIQVKFDTGASHSMLSLKAAARAGIKIDSAGVMEAGYTLGVGRRLVKSYIAPFSSFKIGDNEEIKNARLRIADTDFDDADMLLGADFFVAHHVYVANSQRKIYLTYNGGAVFNLGKGSATTEPTDAQSSAGSEATDKPAAAEAPGKDDAPLDASAVARRGNASATRRDFPAAIADLSKAIDLQPDNPEYFYQRAMAYQQNGQGPLALSDLDKALMLKPDFLPAYLPRAQMRLREKDMAGAMADLETADRLAPKQADLRLSLAELYGSTEHFPLAIAQYDLWIANHADDARAVNAWGGRCLVKALQNQDVSGGLSDCDRGLNRADKSNPYYAQLLADRGLARLRLGNYDKAVADFDAALKMNPKIPRAWFGRGVAKARLKKTGESEADLAEAQKLAPKISEYFARYGIVP